MPAIVFQQRFPRETKGTTLHDDSLVSIDSIVCRLPLQCCVDTFFPIWCILKTMSAFPTFKTEGDYNYMTYEGLFAVPSMNILLSSSAQILPRLALIPFLCSSHIGVGRWSSPKFTGGGRGGVPLVIYDKYVTVSSFIKREKSLLHFGKVEEAKQKERCKCLIFLHHCRSMNTMVLSPLSNFMVGGHALTSHLPGYVATGLLVSTR